MSCVMYIGSQSDRKIIQDYEMSVPASDKGNRKTLGTRFDVLLTSYESLRMDQKFLPVHSSLLISSLLDPHCPLLRD